MSQEMDHPDIHPRVHPPVLFLFHLCAAYLFGWVLPLPWEMPDSIRYAGFGLILSGLLCGFGAILEMRRARTTLDPHGSVSTLVTGGIYRFSRNPIYLGFLMMLIGFPMLSGMVWGILITPVYALTMNQLVITKEETYLEGKFSVQYIAYKSHVRRWL
ncbi:MAG: isoprenylcysteine carboxylmethyltransferase family protein [Chloroflexi bacterium]|nr:isoprenylcysteine carboxylmethyltransferase family protein [Chloroflexota bacterium]